MSDSNNITVLNPGLYKNLLAQVESIYRHSNELSFKTRARYFEATKRFCKFLADNFRLQNFKNVEDRHFKAYVEHLKGNNAAATIQSDLSGIRYFHRKSGSNRKKCRNAYNKEFLDYVCVDDMGNLLRPDYLSQHLQTVLKRNNLKHIRYHDLRHSCASLLLANGVSLKEIQDWLGHSDYSTTANIYSHLEYGAKVKSANKISESLSLEEKTKDG